jgi:tetratricopeptide (TPR) repeat protein
MLSNTNHITSGMQPFFTMTHHLAREAHDIRSSSRINTAITALVLNEDSLPFPSQRMARDVARIEKEGDKGNPAQAHSKRRPLKGTLSTNAKPIRSYSEGAVRQEEPVLTMRTPNTAARETPATPRSSRINEATITALDQDILSTKIVPSPRMGRDEPLLEEGGDTGNPALNRVLSELKSFQKRDLEHCEESLDLAETWNALGLIRLHMQRDAEEARKCHEEALRIYRKCDEDRVSVAVTLNDLGNCYEQLHQSSRALDSYNEALRLLKEQKMAGDHVRMQATLRSISRLSRK